MESLFIIHKKFLIDLKRLITYETRYSLRSPNVNIAGSPLYLSKNHVHDHFEKLYKTTTEATKARISARLNAERENDDPYDPYKFDRRRVDEEANECPKKQSKQGNNQVQNQLKRTKQNAEPSKTCDNGELSCLFLTRRSNYIVS